MRSAGAACRCAGTRLVETLGFERLVHADVPGRPVLTDEVVEVARDIDATVVQELREAARRRARRSRGLTGGWACAGARVDVAVDPAQLYFFDLETGAAIGRAATAGGGVTRRERAPRSRAAPRSCRRIRRR